MTKHWRAVALLSLLFLDPTMAREAAPSLNSERIEQQFGSYGIEVLQHAGVDQYRVSDLYSGQGTERVTRTLALVSLTNTVSPEMEGPHSEIMAGGSIGAVFKAAGWDVRKTHLHIGEIKADPGWQGLWARMAIAPQPLAVNLYRLDVAKSGSGQPYGFVLEIYHPLYLQRGNLEGFVALAPDSDSNDNITARSLDQARQELARLPLPGN